jgi:hypothetical protein
MSLQKKRPSLSPRVMRIPTTTRPHRAGSARPLASMVVNPLAHAFATRRRTLFARNFKNRRAQTDLRKMIQ